MIFKLSFPPSTNSLWRAVKGRNIKSKAYREWEKTAGWELAEVNSGRPGFAGPVYVRMAFGRPDKRKRDLDNLIKAPLDLISTHGLILDDSQVHRIEALWREDIVGMELVVQPL